MRGRGCAASTLFVAWIVQTEHLTHLALIHLKVRGYLDALVYATFSRIHFLNSNALMCEWNS